MSALTKVLWLSLCCPAGSAEACRLIEAFGEDVDALYRASEEDYLALPGMKKELADRLSDKNLDEAKRIEAFCDQYSIGLLPFYDPLYPKRLRRLPDYPPLLYLRGKLPKIDSEVAIATVGTRKMTEYGMENGYTISRDLARAGAIVVSGMASGIDTACHRGALDALGHTIAVLGCGINVVYPKQNAELMEEIAENGTLLTEYPPDTEPSGFHFPKRNRIISGLSLGTLVVEADEKSGAMITVRHAQKQGRDIFALPGKVGEMNSAGTNRLIKEGATVVTSALDILDAYEAIFPQKIHPERVFVKRTSMRVETPSPRLRVASPHLPIRQEADRTPIPEPHEIPGASTDSPTPPRMNKKAPTDKTAKKARSPKEESGQPKKAPAAPVFLPADLSENDRRVLAAMPDGKVVTADEIIRTGIPAGVALASLTGLEIRRLIIRLPDGRHMKNTKQA